MNWRIEEAGVSFVSDNAGSTLASIHGLDDRAIVVQRFVSAIRVRLQDAAIAPQVHAWSNMAIGGIPPKQKLPIAA